MLTVVHAALIPLLNACQNQEPQAFGRPAIQVKEFPDKYETPCPDKFLFFEGRQPLC